MYLHRYGLWMNPIEHLHFVTTPLSTSSYQSLVQLPPSNPCSSKSPSLPRLVDPIQRLVIPSTSLDEGDLSQSRDGTESLKTSQSQLGAQAILSEKQFVEKGFCRGDLFAAFRERNEYVHPVNVLEYSGMPLYQNALGDTEKLPSDSIQC